MTLTVFLIIALVAGLYMAWNIGANDVANAMGTAVGSGALTLKKAIILAAIFEFAGAFLVGGSVSNTIRKGIVPVDAFQQVEQRAVDGDSPSTRPTEMAPAPESTGPSEGSVKLAIGMLSALLASALWLNIATFFGQPVSTTHAIVGAVVGFAIVAAGPGAPNWLKLGEISLGWIISPLCGGTMAYVTYRCIRRFVLRHDDPVRRARAAVPLATGSVIAILTLSVLYKGLHMEIPMWKAIPLALAAGIVTSIIVNEVLKRSVRKRTFNHADRYKDVESWFARIQFLTACYMAFAHGANDVANAIGPLAGAVQVFGYRGELGATTAVPLWLLALGGVGIVLGLATYGYKVIDSVGKKITEITPTRGFSAEFATATTVLVCSKLGWPISTTFVLVGAVMGVGLARGFGAIDMKVIKKIFASWAITIPVSAGFSAVIYIILIALRG